MEILVTGATGFIGKNLVRALTAGDNHVRALYRDEAKLVDMQSPQVSFIKGDVTDKESLLKAMTGCNKVYHLAAYAKVWAKDKEIFNRINIEGTRNVMDAALAAGISKVVVVSTAGVFGPGERVNEVTQRTLPFFSDYERTKAEADAILTAQYSGLIDLCIVCPARVFGPGELSQANSVTRLIRMYMQGRYRFLPGDGLAAGNYVFVDDLVAGMIAAMEKGKPGERYILGGENISYKAFFADIGNISGKNYRMFRIPTALILMIAGIMKFTATCFNIPPLITPGWARKYLYSWNVSSEKAFRQLGYNPRPLKEGLSETIKWLKGFNRS